MTLPKTLPTREIQLHFHLQTLLKSIPELVSFSLIAGQGLPGTCPNFPLPQRSPLTKEGRFFYSKDCNLLASANDMTFA